MIIQKACYSYTNLNKCVNMVKDANWTVKRKGDHINTLAELRKIHEYGYDNINCILFDPYEEPYLKEYATAVDNLKNWTKKELDQKLKTCLRYVQRELNGILTLMLSGEVDSVN